MVMRGYIGFLSFEWHKNTPCFSLSKEFFQLLNREKSMILTHNLQRKEKNPHRIAHVGNIDADFGFVYRAMVSCARTKLLLEPVNRTLNHGGNKNGHHNHHTAAMA